MKLQRESLLNIPVGLSDSELGPASAEAALASYFKLENIKCKFSFISPIIMFGTVPRS